MNDVVKKAKEIISKGEWPDTVIPELEVGDEIPSDKYWDGDSADSFCIQLTDTGEDGTGRYPIWINYRFEKVSTDCVKITGIELV